jgi:hydrogenase 3 maturation protease
MDEMKTSARSWLWKITKAINNPHRNKTTADQPLRFAILGVGNELNGDDAAGVQVARQLAERLKGRSNILIVEGGAAPENFSGLVRRFAPDWLILLDIAGMEGQPGDIDWLEMSEIDGVTAATHSLPVSMLAKYLASETGCQVGAVLIEPVSLDFEADLSQPVARAVDEVVEGLLEFLSNR